MSAFLRQRPPAPGDRTVVLLMADAATGDVGVVEVRPDVRQWAVRVVAGEVAAPHLLEEGDRAGSVDLGVPDLPVPFLSLGLGVTEDDRDTGVDLQGVGTSPHRCEPLVDVGAEGLPVLRFGVGGEDDLGLTGGGAVAKLVSVGQDRCSWASSPVGTTPKT